jgi:tetratricopeptide (TPR) repeat protein
LDLAIAEEQFGSHEAAREAALRAVNLSPSLHGAHFVLGLALYQLNRLDEAVSAFHTETALNPHDVNAWMWSGVASLACDHPQPAVEALVHARALDPNNVDVLYHLGRAYMLLSKEAYDAMYHVDPESARVHETLAQSDAEAGKSADAISEYRLALLRAPSQPGLHEELADELWRASKFEEADHEYAEALRVTPRDAVVLYKEGSLSIIRSDAPRGVLLLEQAIQLDPSLEEAYYQLGVGEFQLHQDQNALGHLKRAAKSDPNSEDRTSTRQPRTSQTSLDRFSGCESQQPCQDTATGRREASQDKSPHEDRRSR